VSAINGPTILLLFGVMGMGAFLALDGFFDGIEQALVRHARTPARLLGSSARPMSPRTTITLAAVGATAVAYTLGADLAWSATTGFVALMLLHRRDTALLWGRIDWSLLLFFAGLFVVVEGLMQSGAPAWLFARFPLAEVGADGLAGWMRAAGLFLVGSNVVSNVPFILVVRDQMATLPSPALGWELLTVTSTFAGNLTLLRSVATIIVSDSARDIGGIGLLDYLKVGVPLAMLTTLIGALWFVAFAPA